MRVHDTKTTAPAPVRPLRRATRSASALMVALAATVAGVVPVAAARAQQTATTASERPAPLPFGIGDTLTYSAHVAKFGRVGRAVMWVEGPRDVHGTAVEVLRFDFRASIGPVKAVDRTESWLDAGRMASLRFHKHERHPLSRHDEKVEMFPEGRRWRGDDGSAGESPTDAPLDELSFMFFIRTLRLPAADTTYEFDRHFDAARNPTTVRVVRRERVTTGAGVFETVLLEMRVRDPRRYRGEGLIRINLTDDARRLPVRIESAMPVIGTAVLTLDGFVSGRGAVVAKQN